MNIAICDDNMLFSHNLHEALVETMGPDLTKLALFATARQLLTHMEDHTIDILFMNIQLCAAAGTNVPRRLLSHDPDMQIVFIADFDNPLNHVRNGKHIYFLKKPIEPRRLQMVLTAAMQRIRQARDSFLTVSTGPKTVKIGLDNILYFENTRKQLLIHLQDGSIIKTCESFEDIESQLSSSFIQCHKRYMVNMAAVSSLSQKKLCIDKRVAIPVSRGYAKASKEALCTFLKRQPQV